MVDVKVFTGWTVMLGVLFGAGNMMDGDWRGALVGVGIAAMVAVVIALRD